MQGIYGMDPTGTECADELLESRELQDSESSMEKNSDDNGSEDLDDGDERDQKAKDDATEDVHAENRSHEEAPVKIVRNPADPTPEEKARHDATHLPYRPRCPICVEARATEDPHYKRTAEERHQGSHRYALIIARLVKTRMIRPTSKPASWPETSGLKRCSPQWSR